MAAPSRRRLFDAERKKRFLEFFTGTAICPGRRGRGFGKTRVVAEKNDGGVMVESVLRGADVALPVKLVQAADGKSARAEPVAALFEAGRAKLAGTFPELENEMCALVLGGGYEGKGARTGPTRGSGR